MNKKQTKETMKITKQIMDGTLEIFDKNFPNEKNTPLKDKKKIVKFFINLNEFCNKKNIKITKEHFEYLQKNKQQPKGKQ